MIDKVPFPKKIMLITVASIVGLVVIVTLVVMTHTSTSKVSSQTTALPAVAKVLVSPTGFSPASISIKQGSTVEFTSTDMAPHWVESDPYPAATSLPALNASAAMGSGDTFTAVINSVGTFTYHDRLNPTLVGTVIVSK